jgi:GNAT superfamily N-acetyltransferase
MWFALAMALKVARFDGATPFLDRVGPFLAEREAEHNLLFGIIDHVRIDPSAFDGPPYLVAVLDDDRVVGTALRTPPYGLVLSEVDDPAVVGSIVDHILAEDSAIPGVLGPVAAAAAFVQLWTSRTGRAHRRGRAQRIFRLRRVVPPPPTDGSSRIADWDDRDILAAWLEAFAAEAVPDEEPHGDHAATVEGWFRTGYRRNHLWVVDGRPVSWAGLGGPTPRGIRVGPVYTPPADRGRGYASAVVAAASQSALDEGREFCFLFTDLANPTANHIYQAIGYEPVTDVDAWYFG